MTAPELPDTSPPAPETEETGLVIVGSDDAPVCTDGVCVL